MAVASRRGATGLVCRPYAPSDEAAVLGLVAADRLPGQPAITPAMLREAVAGNSVVDAGWWAELDPPRTDVLVEEGTGRVVGVVSYAVRSRDGAGLVLWLHGGETPGVVDALIDRALEGLGRQRTLEAFAFASALSLGLEGLPVRHRRVTHEALVRAGFAGDDLWRYMRRELAEGTTVGIREQTAHAAVAPTADPPGWRLELRDRDGTLVGEATVGVPVDGIGVLWWIGIAPSCRGRGLSRPLLAQALAVLAEHGAREVILFVDDDEPPGGERDRTAANRLYDGAGFVEIDRLYSYTRRP